MLTPVNPPNENWPGVSMGVILKGSGTFVSTGHMGTDAAGKLVTSSIEDQVVAVFENVKRTLAAAGLGFEHVARVTGYIPSWDNPEVIDTIRRVRQLYYASDCPPASVIVAAGLIDPQAVLEVEVIAVVP